MIKTSDKMNETVKETLKMRGDNISLYAAKRIEELEEQVKNCPMPDVAKSLPTDECVEQWWTEGQDKNKGFWQEAPYRTNGDVVEEIKTAINYFIKTWQR